MLGRDQPMIADRVAALRLGCVVSLDHAGLDHAVELVEHLLPDGS
jgi:hypothetical protein